VGSSVEDARMEVEQNQDSNSLISHLAFVLRPCPQFTRNEVEVNSQDPPVSHSSEYASHC
jgi:hypothetical protein